MAKKSFFIGNRGSLTWKYGDRMYRLQPIRDNEPEDPRVLHECHSTFACWHRRYKLGDDIGKVTTSEFFQNLVEKYFSDEELFKAALNGDITGIRLSKAEEDGYDIYETYSYPLRERLEYENILEKNVAYYILINLTVQQCIALLEPYVLCMPLWLYDHSGLSMSCGKAGNPYSDNWDSGVVGFAVVEKAKLLNEVQEAYINADGDYDYRSLTDDNWKKTAEELVIEETRIYDEYLQNEVYWYEVASAEIPDIDGEPEWEPEYGSESYYGMDIIANGAAENIGCGLYQAIQDNAFDITWESISV